VYGKRVQVKLAVAASTSQNLILWIAFSIAGVLGKPYYYQQFFGDQLSLHGGDYAP